MNAIIVRVATAAASTAIAAGLLVGPPAAAQDLLFVADKGAQTVNRYALPSTSGTVFGSGPNPELYGLATGASGELYSVNNTGDSIRRFSADGSLIFDVDIKTTTSSTAFGPVGVAFTPASGGRLIVSAYNSNNLLRLDAATGVWDTSFGAGGVMATTGSPLGVAVTSSANFIYYTQTDNTVWRADGNGTNAIQLGFSTGESPTSPWSLALLNDTQLFIADISSDEVLKYTLSGSNATLVAGYGTSGRVSVTDGVYGIAVSPSGVAYVTSPNVGVVKSISADGGSVTQLITGFTDPTGIAVGQVPEIDPAGLTGVLALVTGTLGVVERRRQPRRTRS